MTYKPQTKRMPPPAPESRPRSYERVEVRGRALIHNEDHLYIAPLRNISLGGIFVDHLICVPLGTEVKVVVQSPDLPASLQVTGIVVRVETGPRMGLAVEFKNLPDDVKMILREYVFQKRTLSPQALGLGPQFRRL